MVKYHVCKSLGHYAWENAFVKSIFVLISLRFKLPFRCTTTTFHSSHRVECPPIEDPLTTSPVAKRMLRIAWNIAWHGGIKELMVKIQSNALGESCSRYESQKPKCTWSIFNYQSYWSVKIVGTLHNFTIKLDVVSKLRELLAFYKYSINGVSTF